MPDDTVLLERHFDTAFAAPDGIQKLRELILTLAIQGKLVPQDPKDQPASELLKEIEVEKQRLEKEGKLKQSKPLPEINLEEVPYELPDAWKWVRLGNCMLKITDGTHHSPPNGDAGDFLYISAKNIKEEGILLKNATYITKKIHDEIYSRCDPEFGNILYIKDGATTGIATINNLKEPFSMLSSVALLKQPTQIDNHYLLFTLRSPFFYSEMRAGMTGVAITRVTLKKMNDAIIPLPPLAEQRRIVVKIDRLMAHCDELEKLRAERNQKRITIHTAALDRLLNAKESNDFSTAWRFITQHFGELYSVEENVAELRKAILQLAVMGKLVPQDPTDEPASELLRAIAAKKQRLVKEKKLKIGQLTNDSKSTNANIAIPSSWSWVKGIDLFFITKLAGFEYTEHIILLDIGEVPVIRAQNVKPFKLNVDNLKYIDLNTSKLLERCSLTKAALLVTFIGAGIGDVALFDFQERWHLAPNVAKMEPFSGCENKVNLKYIAYFLNSSVGRNEIFKHLKSTAQPSISMGTIRDIDYPLPPLPEQHRIVTKIDQLMALCNHLDRQIDAATGKQSALLNAVMAQV